jgi:hypothetical protein
MTVAKWMSCSVTPGVGAAAQGVEVSDQGIQLCVVQWVTGHQGAERLAGGPGPLANGALERLDRVGRAQLRCQRRFAGGKTHGVVQDVRDDRRCDVLAFRRPDTAAAVATPADDLLAGQWDIPLDDPGHALTGGQHALHIHAPAGIHLGRRCLGGWSGDRSAVISPGRHERGGAQQDTEGRDCAPGNGHLVHPRLISHPKDST